MRQLIVTVTPEGDVQIEATGFKGNACEKATAELEKAFGLLKSKTKKPEYYVADTAAQQKMRGGR